MIIPFIRHAIDNGHFDEMGKFVIGTNQHIPSPYFNFVVMNPMLPDFVNVTLIDHAYIYVETKGNKDDYPVTMWFVPFPSLDGPFLPAVTNSPTIIDARGVEQA